MRALEEASRQLKELPICTNQRSDIQIDEIRCDISLRRRQREVFPRHHRLLAASKPGRQGADPKRGHLEHHPQGQDYGDGRGDTDRAALPAEPQLRDEGDLLLQAPAIRPRDSGSIEQDADTVAFISRLSVVNIHEDPDTHLPTRGGARSCWPRTAKASWDTCASCTTRA